MFRELNREFKNDSILIELAILLGKWDTLGNTKFNILKNELCVHRSIVLRRTQIVITLSLRNRVLEIAHERLRKCGNEKSTKKKVWWEGIDKDAEKCIKTC